MGSDTGTCLSNSVTDVREMIETWPGILQNVIDLGIDSKQ